MINVLCNAQLSTNCINIKEWSNEFQRYQHHTELNLAPYV